MADNYEYYVRDYTAELPEGQDTPEVTKAWEVIGTVLGDMKEFDDNAVKFVNPIAKANYECMLQWSEAMAKEYYGRVTGCLKMEFSLAEILLEVPYFDFINENEREFMHTALKVSDSIALETSKDELIRIRMWFKYFEPYHTDEEREEFHRKAALHMQQKIEELENG